MAASRRLRALLVLAAVALVLAGVWALGPEPPDDGSRVEVTLVVVEPDGDRPYDGGIRARNGTVLGALAAGAEAGGFPYETETYSMGVQVVSINGTRNEGSSGWVYRVRSDGAWCWGDRSSDRYPVEDGDRVRWEWAEEPPGGGCWEAGEG